MRKLIILFLTVLTFSGMFYSCQNSETIKQDAYYVNGRDLYIKHCQNCHGTKGEGLGELIPPLTDSVFMKTNKQKLACYIKNGVSERLTVHGKVYEGKMEPLNLANIDLAQVIVYITNGFGHQQGMYTTEQVTTDLGNCK